MNINKAIAPILASIALSVVAMVPSMAAPAPGGQAVFASATAGGTIDQQSVVYTYTGGASGQFSTSAGGVFTGLSGGLVNPNSTLTFTGFGVSGAATGDGSSANPYTQGLGAGTFNLYNGDTTLLSGTFTGGNILTVASGSTTASITNTVNNVTYTGGLYYTNSGLLNPGSFVTSLLGVNPSPTIGSDGFLTGFSAGGTTNFSATTPRVTTVPEPATVAPFIMGGLGLMGLAFRARKTRRSNGTAA
jgi:hypothetical protein